MLLAFGLTIGSTMGIYFGSIYLPSWAAHTGRIAEEAASAQHNVALVALLVAMITSGFLSDRFGPLALIRIGFTGCRGARAPVDARLRVTGTSRTWSRRRCSPRSSASSWA